MKMVQNTVSDCPNCGTDEYNTIDSVDENDGSETEYWKCGNCGSNVGFIVFEE